MSWACVYMLMCSVPDMAVSLGLGLRRSALRPVLGRMVFGLGSLRFGFNSGADGRGGRPGLGRGGRMVRGMHGSRRGLHSPHCPREGGRAAITSAHPESTPAISTARRRRGAFIKAIIWLRSKRFITQRASNPKGLELLIWGSCPDFHKRVHSPRWSAFLLRIAILSPKGAGHWALWTVDCQFK